MKQIYQGAEAVVYEYSMDNTNCIVKDRISKDYRIKEIDVSIRKSRTKRETKILKKLEEIGVRVPKLLNVKDDGFAIVMEKIEGIRLKDLMMTADFGENNKETKKDCQKFDSKRLDYKKYFRDLGSIVAKMHCNGIIHSDLTTSNILVDNSERLVIIDFGLSFFSQKIEDMAVDIHLVKETLRSTHPDIYEISFKEFLRGYNFSLSEQVIKRLEIVESRGRYKKAKSSRCKK